MSNGNESEIKQGGNLLSPEAFDKAVQAAVKKYPWLSKLDAPIKLTAGTGPYETESFMPHEQENPEQGFYVVQLRSPRSKSNPALWPAILASESLDWLARMDPYYMKWSQAFLASMTNDQKANIARRYNNRLPDDSSNYPRFLRNMIQEYVRGYLFPEVAPGWIGPKGEGGYTPSQIQLLEALKSHLYGNSNVQR
jgi:hypothetical protein